MEDSRRSASRVLHSHPNNSNLTQEEPSQKDQTQQPQNPSQELGTINEEGPPSSHHTPIHTPLHHSAAILYQTPALFSPRAYPQVFLVLCLGILQTADY